MLPFWPKMAGVEDAPNYRPTAGDDRCENCAYYRALNNGAGYCERFSFECEPQSVCDDFVRAGQSKMSSAPASTLDRLKAFAANPVTRSVGINTAIGSAAGAGIGAVGSGEDAGSSAATGALAGGLAGTGIGTIGPLMRAGKISKQFGPKMDEAIKSFDKKAPGRTLKYDFDDYLVKDRTARTNQQISDQYVTMRNNRKNLADVEKNLKMVNSRLQQIGPNPQLQNAQKALQDARDQLVNAEKSIKTDIEKLRNQRLDLDRMKITTEQSRKNTLARVAEERKALEEQKKKGVVYDPKDLAKASPLEAAAVPGLSALVGGGLGFGVSHDAKEQERFRRSRQG